MTEHDIVRGMLLRISEDASAPRRLIKSLRAWAKPHTAWLIGHPGGKVSWPELIDALGHAHAPEERLARPLQLAGMVSKLLAFTPFDTGLLSIVIAADRMPRVAAVARIIAQNDYDLPTLLGVVAGADPTDAQSRVKASLVLRLGLARFDISRQGHASVDLDWLLDRLLDRALTDPEDIINTLAGARQSATLSLADFDHIADADFLVRLLRGAAVERAEGINILIHGAPGIGKTELARTLACAAGLNLHAVGEANAEGDEPDRDERVNALRLAQRLLANRGDAALLFDEMEDFIGNAQPSGGDWFAKREGSKVFVNRQLETNPIPVIWTTNAIGNIDAAIIRRMSFVLKLDLPSRRVGQRMLDRIAADEHVIPGDGFGTLLDVAPETSTVLRVAARAGRMAGEADGGVRPAEALVRTLRSGELPNHCASPIDFGLFDADVPLEPLFDRIALGEHLDISLLLTGPPGTGKTALAHHLARILDRPLVIKRASDLLSKWVGETEAQIAASFAEARARGGVLLFDEADSLLFDRTTARTSWEVGQVNELLTWLDSHPLPVIAATDHPGGLDPATLRRFVFKLDLKPLAGERLNRAYATFFGGSAPAELADVRHLTPGDFAVVSRQLRHAPTTNALTIVDRLAAEAAAKPGGRGRIGF